MLIRKDRDAVIHEVDWRLVLFIIFMFMAIDSILEAGIVVSTLYGAISLLVIDASIILLPILFSQAISNVPTVQLLLRFLSLQNISLSSKQLVLLAYTSTIAGNLLPFSAASNIIIIDESRSKGIIFNVKKFLLYGLVFTFIELVVAVIFMFMI